jgi:two-component system NarL family sensor kinase
VRGISHRLRPALLDTLGLPAALERLGVEFGDEGPIEAAVSIHGTPRELPQEVKTALFRVAQEALTNVRKHSHARKVDIALAFDARHVRLDITDDGRGFDEEAVQADPRSGIGLRNMRERVAAIGGRLDVHSGDAGTSILAEVALEGPEAG